VSSPPSPTPSPAPQTRLPQQRWQEPSASLAEVQQLAQAIACSPLVAQLLINRGMGTPEAARGFLAPESLALPNPLTVFPDLATSVALLQGAIAPPENQPQRPITICGDYDADGMTSTALLLRTLRYLGGQVDYAIPSRMQEGYGINQRIVEDCHRQGVGVILTVDNGIAAMEPIAQARALGLQVIITDHHDLPPQLPPANAILNPKRLPTSSPYHGLAGVGVAYILAVSIAQALGRAQTLIQPLLELFTLGTIADLAPLQGVNRRWVQRGLQMLPQSQLTGVRALMAVSGVTPEPNQQDRLQPADIGFRLGPRINAVGRIGDPQIVIDLLTTEDLAMAQKRAQQCEAINQQRRHLCSEIEQAAIAWCEATQFDPQTGVLAVVQPDWHHGVIGIVASRLVERYGVPVFIATYEGADQNHIRGSARGIREFHVFEALQACADLLGRYGGHQAAGGFSLAAQHWPTLVTRLQKVAQQQLRPEHLKPLVVLDAKLNFDQIHLDLYQELTNLHPCGIANPTPTFWTPGVEVLQQSLVGQVHLKLQLRHRQTILRGIAWRSGAYYPLPPWVDIAYHLQTNHWQGITRVELEVVGVRETTSQMIPSSSVSFHYQHRPYRCQLIHQLDAQELHIWNQAGDHLTLTMGAATGYLQQDSAPSQAIDICQPFFRDLIAAATQVVQCYPPQRT